MNSNVAIISKLYENAYSSFVKSGTPEKDSFYILNNILIMISLQSFDDNSDANISFQEFERKIKHYEKKLGTPLFFKCSSAIFKLPEFEDYYGGLKNAICAKENGFENTQSVLGYVLEKHINRKKTGSYYTPDDTTKYITFYSVFLSFFNLLSEDLQVKTVSIMNEIVSKLNPSRKKIKNQYDIIKYSIDLVPFINEMPNHYSHKELLELNRTINKLRIIDPTCGSGAFIITAFDFIYFIKERINCGRKINPKTELTNILNTLHGLDNSYEAICLLKMRLILKFLSKGTMPSSFEKIFTKNFILADAFTGSDYIITDNQPGSFDWKSFGHKFDCVIGNPPYVENHTKKTSSFSSLKCGNLYAYTIERAYNILNNDGTLSFIVPLPLIATPRMKPIRDYMFANSSILFISSYADRPGCIFKGVHQRLVIFFGNKSTDTCQLNTSSYKYWYNSERSGLFKNITYILNDDKIRVPKIGNCLEKRILQKVANSESVLYKIYTNSENTKNKIYLSTRLGLWSKSFTDKPDTNEVKVVCCDTSAQKHIINAFFNSSTFYFLWILLSDCWHITSNDIKNIRFDYSSLSNDNQKKLVILSKELEKDLEKHKKYIGSKQVEYEYKHKLSKNIIDNIDQLIAKTYGFDEEEIKYIIEFAYKYRMNDIVKEEL